MRQRTGAAYLPCACRAWRGAPAGTPCTCPLDSLCEERRALGLKCCISFPVGGFVLQSILYAADNLTLGEHLSAETLHLPSGLSEYGRQEAEVVASIYS